jgi:hypothetical protein
MTEAERLAKVLDQLGDCEAAALLRSQSAEIERLRSSVHTIDEAYQSALDELDKLVPERDALRLALDSLAECEPRPDGFDFGPAYEGAVQRRAVVISTLESLLP